MVDSIDRLSVLEEGMVGPLSRDNWAIIVLGLGVLSAAVVLAKSKVKPKEEDVLKSGYRLVINCGVEGGQLVPHLHMHLLGGRRLSDALG